MICREQDNSEGFCGLMLWCGICALKGLEKKIMLTFQKCYLRCKMTIDRLYAQNVMTRQDPLSVRNFYVQTLLCGYFLSEIARSAMQASPDCQV